MSTGVVVREATLADTDRALHVVRQSITQLCALDHKNEPTTLGLGFAGATARK